jgi:hypothetical protein
MNSRPSEDLTLPHRRRIRHPTASLPAKDRSIPLSSFRHCIISLAVAADNLRREYLERCSQLNPNHMIGSQRSFGRRGCNTTDEARPRLPQLSSPRATATRARTYQRGAVWEYDDWGFDMLGCLVEVASGEPPAWSIPASMCPRQSSSARRPKGVPGSSMS